MLILLTHLSLKKLKHFLLLNQSPIKYQGLNLAQHHSFRSVKFSLISYGHDNKTLGIKEQSTNHKQILRSRKGRRGFSSNRSSNGGKQTDPTTIRPECQVGRLSWFGCSSIRLFFLGWRFCRPPPLPWVLNSDFIWVILFVLFDCLISF